MFMVLYFFEVVREKVELCFFWLKFGDGFYVCFIDWNLKLLKMVISFGNSCSF